MKCTFPRLAAPPFLPVALTLGTLASCSSSSDGPADATGGPVTVAEHVFLTSSLAGPQSVSLVDAANPTAPVVAPGVDASNFAYAPVLFGTPSSGGTTLSGVQFSALAVRNATTVGRQPLAYAVGSTPSVFQLKAYPAGVAGVDVDADHTTHVEIYTVELSSGDYETFEFDGSSTTASTPFPGTPITTYGDPATGAFEGWVGLDGGMLTVVDRSSVSTDLVAAANVTELDANDAGDMFMLVDGAIGVFHADGTYDAVAFTPQGAGDFDLGDHTAAMDDALFALSPVAVGSFEIVRVEAAGTAAAIGATITGVPDTLVVSGTRIAVQYDDMNGAQLASFDLSGANRVDLETNATSVDVVRFAGEAVRGDRVAYTLDATDTVDVALDGTGRVVHTGRTLVGLAIGGDLGYGGTHDVTDLFLASDGGGGALALESVPFGGATGARIALGTLDASFDQVFASSAFSATAIVTATDQVTPQSDVYFCATRTAGSLQRVTNTPSLFELGIL